MKSILGTNVLSELLRPDPARQVERWLAAQDGAKVYFTTVGEAELRQGVAILPAGKRSNALTTAIEGPPSVLITYMSTQHPTNRSSVPAPAS